MKVRFPRRHRVKLVVGNAIRFTFRGAWRNWYRNLASTAPALGSMTLLLLLLGLTGMTGFALRNLTDIEARDASLLHIYLKDDASDSDVAVLKARLKADHRISQVGYTTKEQALQRASKRPGLPDLADATASNPFPASLDVQVKRVQDVGAVDSLVRHDPSVDPIYPTSYDRGAYQRIQQALLVIAILGGAFLTLLAFVAVTVTANSIRGAIIARKDEVAIMQLVGAPRWMVRGPFVVEGALTGGLAGGVAGLIVLGVSLAAIAAGTSSFAQVAPGVTAHASSVAALMVLAIGLVLGSVSSVLGLRRYMET